MAQTVLKKTAARKPVKRSGAAKKTTAQRPVRRTGAAKKATVQRKPAPSAALATAVDAQVLAHGLNGLLHTMHAVQQFEETLCSLMHALRRGRATGTLLRDLREVLEQLPARDYQHEVDALRDAIAA